MPAKLRKNLSCTYIVHTFLQLFTTLCTISHYFCRYLMQKSAIRLQSAGSNPTRGSKSGIPINKGFSDFLFPPCPHDLYIHCTYTQKTASTFTSRDGRQNFFFQSGLNLKRKEVTIRLSRCKGIYFPNTEVLIMLNCYSWHIPR